MIYILVQGTEDKLVPLAYSEYAARLVPHVQLHKLEGEGHFSWFCHCDTCHRDLFKILFGEVEGLDELDAPEPEATKKSEATGNLKNKESHAAKSEKPHEAHEEQSSFPSKAEHIMSREAEVGISSDDVDDRVTTHHHENHEEEDEL